MFENGRFWLMSHKTTQELRKEQVNLPLPLTGNDMDKVREQMSAHFGCCSLPAIVYKGQHIPKRTL